MKSGPGDRAVSPPTMATPIFCGAFRQAGVDRLRAQFRLRGDGDRDEGVQGRPAHGRDIGDGTREGFPADFGGSSAARKWTPSITQSVFSRRQILAAGIAYHGAIVAGTADHVGRAVGRPRNECGHQFVFAEPASFMGERMVRKCEHGAGAWRD